MNIPQYFLCSATMAPTGRWLQAFPQGESVEVAELGKRLPAMLQTKGICWLATSDPQWQQHLQTVVKADPAARIVVLSGVPVPEEGMAALGAGARGYTHAYAVPEMLQEVATVIEHGGLWAGPELLQRLVASTAAALAKLPVAADSEASVSAVRNAKLWATLSAREAEVAQSVAQGRSNKEVADQLFISERTVKAHLGAAFEKLGIRDRLQLALFAASVKPKMGDAASAGGASGAKA